MKRALYISLTLMTLFFVSSCMLVFHLALPEGVYVVGDWNGWEPTANDKMDSSSGSYKFILPVSSITFYPSEDAPSYHVGWYKVVYVSKSNTIVSAPIPVWRENIEGTSITIYASPTLMKDGLAVGVGDSEKEDGGWYVAGAFNSWQLKPMKADSGKYIYEVKYTIKKGENMEYKIARNTDWKPYEEQYDGKHYHAGYNVNASFVADKDATLLIITYDPKYSLLKMEAK